MNKQIPIQFIGEVTGVPFQITPEITKARLRIFYKGLNRNGGFITDEFAEKLLMSLPYAPVVGIYNDLTKEFSGHDPNRNTAKIYGVVPQDPNVTWEDNLDKDGIMRTYACCDVYLYTGRYDAARQIVGKQHSMELNEKTIQGNWKVIDEYGTEAYVYTDARFIGLSVLGDNKEPCFEGSAFFELVTKFSNFMMDNTSNGGTEMTAKEKEKESSASFENEVQGNFVEEEKETDKKENTPSGDSATQEENKKEEENTPSEDSEKKEEQEQADSACKPDKDSACKPDEDSACNPEKKDYAEDKKKEPDDKTDEKGEEPEDDDDDDEDDMSDHSSENYSKENFEKLNNKILELEGKITTFESEANKYKELYKTLKVDYDHLVSEKNAQLLESKKKKIQEYSAYLSPDAKEKFENNLNDYSTVDDLEKDLLFASKSSLFASHENFAPTSTYEVEEEDELAAFIREKITH